MSDVELRERLADFLSALIADQGLAAGEIAGATPLIGDEGPLDSAALLHLAAWIEGECGGEIDLTDVDMIEEWGTMDAIVAFVGTRRSA